MRFLSNLFSRTGLLNNPPQISAASPEELAEATELLLTGPDRQSHAHEVGAFLESLRSRGVDVGAMRVVKRGKRVTYAVLPSLVPGRMLMLISGTPTDTVSRADAAALIRQVSEEYARTDLCMMQSLLDPADQVSRMLYAECGFEQMAELTYLERDTEELAQEFPPDVSIENYTPTNHADFAAAIIASYEQTLDCPALNGVREVEDVIAGHRAAGEYSPANWFLLRQEGRPAGVLVLAKVPGAATMELVYIGLAAPMRGKGIARQLMRLALTRAHQAGCRTLTTAVDSSNTPAVKMYLRAGMRRIGSRTAMVRVIHRQG